MEILIYIALGFATLRCVNFFRKNRRAKKILLTTFRSGNVCVAGCKGNGKDMLFYNVIRMREKDGEIHAANIKYTENTTQRSVNYYKLFNNGTKNFIDEDYNPEIKRFTEKQDYYISDCGLALPAWQRAKLEKDFPTFPIVYALSRQLADFNIHSNAQTYNLIWDKLRYQANYFITCTSCKVFGRLVTQRYIIYNRRESAEEGILPFECRRNFLGLKNRHDLENATVHNARYGYIEKFTLFTILPKNRFIYDTREFHTKLYGEPAPKLNKKKSNVKKGG